MESHKDVLTLSQVLSINLSCPFHLPNEHSVHILAPHTLFNHSNLEHDYSKPTTPLVAITAFNMSEAFLYELLQESNVVRLEGEQCGICLEKYNTLSRETGTMEVAIRLPCNHVIGSACIATWLKDTNSCPFCRREFFQAQPRPYLEHGIFDGPENEDELDQQTTSAIIEDFCDNLGLSSGVSIITRYLVQNLTESRIMDERDPHWCVIAVGIYMGSHIAREPRSPREIAEFAGLGAGRLREAYDRIYPEREELIDNHLNTLLAEVFDETGLLNWSARGVELTDEEIESNRDLLLGLTPLAQH